MINWTKLEDNNMPEPNKFVWVKRKHKDYANVYLAARKDKPLSVNPDASRDCYWYGNPLETALIMEGGSLIAHHNFSDVTVEEWADVEPPQK